MESIIILAIIYFVFKAVTKKGNNVWNTVKAKIEEAAESQAGHPAGSGAPRTRQRVRETPKPAETQFNNENAPYVPIQPTIRANNAQYADSGSMGAVSPEGTRSAEGMGTELDPGQMRATPIAAYALNEAQSASLPILPARWDSNAMAQAAVMSIVLERPKKWGERIG